jgi:hypothetical protein
MIKFNNENGHRNPGNEYIMTNDNTNMVTTKLEKDVYLSSNLKLEQITIHIAHSNSTKSIQSFRRMTNEKKLNEFKCSDSQKVLT